MTEQADKAANTAQTPRVDDFVEDVFGLNVRGLGTIKDMFVRPAAVFQAARTPHWQGRYTPSIRLLFSIITVMMVMRFIWAGEDSGFSDMMTAAQLQANPDVTPEAIQQLSNNYLLVYPFAAMAVFFLASLLVNIWGKGTALVSRIRIFFLALVPNFTATLVLMIPIADLKGQTFMLASLGLAVILTLIDGLTVFRGLQPVYSIAQRLWRSVLFGAVSFICLNLTAIIGIFGAGLIASFTGS